MDLIMFPQIHMLKLLSPMYPHMLLSSYVEAVAPFGGGALGRWLDLGKILRVRPQDEISGLIRRDARELAVSPLCEKRVIRQQAARQEEGPY